LTLVTRAGRINPVTKINLAEVYRREADECRKQADRSVLSADKDEWLRLAQKWTAWRTEQHHRVRVARSRAVLPAAHECRVQLSSAPATSTGRPYFCP
jgi:hypothetical protein